MPPAFFAARSVIVSKLFILAAPRALFDACATAGINKLIQISALGCRSEAKSHFHLSKRHADEYCAALAEKNGLLQWTVLRPSLVIGRGGQSTALFTALAALPWPIRIGPGTWQLQPIHVADLAHVVRLLLETDKPLPRFLDLGGAAPLTTDELTEKMRSWLLLPRRSFLPIPASVLRTSARLGDFLALGPLSTDALNMLARGNTADSTPLRETLGSEPRPLSEALAGEPSTQADIWHARLFFLRPALRIGLALLWISTAIISAFVHPIDKSTGMLVGLGVSGWYAAAIVYAGAALDAVLGIALLAGFRPPLIGVLQIATMAVFTILATIAIPEAWTEPFGPLTKNLAVLLATLVMIALEAKS